MPMKNREEDIEVNLTGEETIGNDASKSRWFKRIRKGITTSTADKKKRLKDYGQSAPPVIIYVPVPN